MKNDFMALAFSIKQRLEERYDDESRKDFYIYQTLLKLITDWNQHVLPSEKTDIGSAALIFFDSEDPEIKRLRSDISELSWLYRRRARRERLGMSPF